MSQFFFHYAVLHSLIHFYGLFIHEMTIRYAFSATSYKQGIKKQL